MKMNKAVLILSGGLDSTTLLYELLDKNFEVFAISFYYGQKHNKELDMVIKTCQKLKVDHKIIDLSGLPFNLFPLYLLFLGSHLYCL